VVCLSECMAKAGGVDATHEAITRAFDTYQHQRKANADAIADMALENFVEMRDKVGQPEFLYKKRIEQTLIRLFPDRCQGQYNLVSFSTVPYVLAQQRGRELDEVCAKVIARLPASAGAGLDAEAFTRQVGEIGKAVLDGGAAEGAAVVLDAATAIDITPPLSERTMVWPGDTPIKRTVLMDMAKGDNFTLSAVSTTVHLGAHADGPNHYGHPALSIGEMPLKHYVGPCQVIVCNARRGERVRVDELVGGVGQVTSARVLLKTSSFDGFSAWNADFCGLSVELVEQLAARGVITIGVDTPSVDPQTSKAMEAHKAIFKAGIAIIEGLALQGVAPGHYVMSAAPLPLMGFDGSPLRALLWAVPGAAKV